MSNTAESSPSSQVSRGGKRTRGAKRGAVSDNFIEEIDSNGATVVHCQECRKDFKHPSKVSTLSDHWKRKHPEKEQPATKIGNIKGRSQLNSKKERIENSLTSALAIPGYQINMFLYPSMRKLFGTVNPNVEFPASFDTLKSMLVNKCTTIKKSMKTKEEKSVAILALEVLSVPATSAPIERVFSLAGLATGQIYIS